MTFIFDNGIQPSGGGSSAPKLNAELSGGATFDGKIIHVPASTGKVVFNQDFKGLAYDNSGNLKEGLRIVFTYKIPDAVDYSSQKSSDLFHLFASAEDGGMPFCLWGRLNFKTNASISLLTVYSKDGNHGASLTTTEQTVCDSTTSAHNTWMSNYHWVEMRYRSLSLGGSRSAKVDVYTEFTSGSINLSSSTYHKINLSDYSDMKVVIPNNNSFNIDIDATRTWIDIDGRVIWTPFKEI